MSIVRQVVFLLVGSLLIPLAAVAQPTFQGIGVLSRETSPASWANSVSFDGLFVAGASRNLAWNREAVRWSALDRQLLPLGFLRYNLPQCPQCPDTDSEAIAVSEAGEFVVGRSADPTQKPPQAQAFIWNRAAGINNLFFCCPFTLCLSARAISQDGSVILGQGSGSAGYGYGLFRKDGWYPLGDPLLLGNDLSPDGLIVCGSRGAPGAGQPREAIRWTSRDGVLRLGDLEGGPLLSGALAMSRDGTRLVGLASAGVRPEAVLWRCDPHDGVSIQRLWEGAGPAVESTARAVCGEGVLIGGWYRSTLQPAAFIWDEHHGARDLRQVLCALRLDVSRWTLESVNDISDDGLTICGNGVNPEGYPEGWVVRLDHRPPCTADWNRSGFLDAADFFEFLEDFFAGDADVTCDHAVTSADFFEFLVAFFRACG